MIFSFKWLKIKNYESSEKIDDLAFERVRLPEYKSAEEIITIIRNIMRILDQEFSKEDIRGFILEWNRKTDDISLKTYPSEAFPNCFYSGEEGMQKWARMMSKAKCVTWELTLILRFFDETCHVNRDLSKSDEEKEINRFVFK